MMSSKKNGKVSSRTRRWISAGLCCGLLLGSMAWFESARAEPKATASAVKEKKIEWRTDLDATLAEAKKQDKHVLLRFTASWCAPCRVMDARVWPDSAVQSALADKYLIVKADIDVDDSQAAIRKYGIQAVPNLLLLDSNGKQLDRAGFLSTPKLVKFLNDGSHVTDESDKPADTSS